MLKPIRLLMASNLAALPSSFNSHFVVVSFTLPLRWCTCTLEKEIFDAVILWLLCGVGYSNTHYHSYTVNKKDVALMSSVCL